MPLPSAPLAPAPAYPRARRKLFKKQPAYLTLLCSAAEHPDAPAAQRRQLTLWAREEAVRLTPVETTGELLSEVAL